MRRAGLTLLAAAVLSSCGADDPIESVFSTLPPPTSTIAEAATDTTTSAPSTDDEAGESESDAIEPEPEPVAPTTTAPPAIPGPDQALLDSIEIAGQTIGTVEQAIGLAFHPTSGTVLLAQRTGLVIDFSDARAGDAVLDLRDDLSMVGESGLLAMTYDPPAEHLYVSFINAANDNRIVAYDVDEAGLPQADTAEVILAVDQPDIIHNGGHIAFGPDGQFYVGLGDGGPGDDPDDRGQSLDSLLGKILRITPEPGSEAGYSIPDDNPFLEVDGAAGEIWAYGLRNPWRFGFDRATGDFYTGDVGQYVVEEINFVPAGESGANFGWARLEGPIRRGSTPADHVPPLSFYNHDDGRCAIIAGTVYRGTAIPELRGAFVYGDYCDGQVRALTQIDGDVISQRSLGITTGQLTGFAEDLGGELYVLNLAGEIIKITPG
jgi:glucose/arabinose dehydrogenase